MVEEALRRDGTLATLQKSRRLARQCGGQGHEGSRSIWRRACLPRFGLPESLQGQRDT